MNNVSIILDIILVVVLILCVIEGYKKGFLSKPFFAIFLKSKGAGLR